MLRHLLSPVPKLKQFLGTHFCDKRRAFLSTFVYGASKFVPQVTSIGMSLAVCTVAALGRQLSAKVDALAKMASPSEDGISADLENWMTKLPPQLHDVPINNLSIPGKAADISCVCIELAFVWAKCLQ